MANYNELGLIVVLTHRRAEITPQSIGYAYQNYTEYLPYPDDNFQEIVDDRYQRGDKFTIEHIYRRTGHAFVPNVPVHVKSIVTEHSSNYSAAFIDPYL
ncbi:unnamed protein product [Rotaria sordida]|uniref:Uncharacterized protein n=2 Tax=Rotaria sordida TaxID=392033 RepID=A0A815E147_9BILA|nr:unnamed protein product [Rotaria sordida]